MTLRHLIPALAILAAAPIATSQLAASEIAAGDLKVKLGLRLQSRLEMGTAETAAGDDADINGTADEDGQTFDLYLRRVRFGMSGSWKSDTKFNFTVSADNNGIHGGASKTPQDRRNAEVRYAWVSHTIKSDDISHTIKFGLDKAFLVSGDFDSSSGMLFPTGRPTGALAWDRTVGLSYMLSAPVFKFGADLMNGDNNAIRFSVRAETWLKEEWGMKRTQSMLGKEGFHHVLGVELGILTESDEEDDGLTQFGIDYNVHYNNITGNVDLVMRSFDEDRSASRGDTDLIFSVQGGYAVPLESGHVVEPALRIAFIDFDREGDTPLPGFEDVDSGIQFDLGVNYYFAGHNNKIQAAISSWSADEGDATKTIFRLQHQLNF